MNEKDFLRMLRWHQNCKCGNHRVNGVDTSCIDFMINKIEKILTKESRSKGDEWWHKELKIVNMQNNA